MARLDVDKAKAGLVAVWAAATKLSIKSCNSSSVQTTESSDGSIPKRGSSSG